MQYTKTVRTLESIVLNQNEMLDINAPKKFWLNNVLISTEDLIAIGRTSSKKEAKLDFNRTAIKR